ncbi:hypothetical protein NL50_15935 [Clostridium acetobutylicum]|nr:hypothetical protein NL50_15935 [Clostridium acetobutylicum]
MKRKLILIAVVIMFMFTGCSLGEKKVNISNSEKLKLKPNEVIENYFKYYGEKSRTGMLSTLTPWQNKPNTNFEFDNLKSINLINIVEDSNSKQKEAYMKYGRGSVNGVKEENVRIYKVTFDVKCKKDDASAFTTGRNIELFTVIRKNKNSPWLIDDHGEE